MEKINFIKMNGAGNDFILIDQKGNKTFKPNPQIVKDMCNRRKGIGADGLLLIKENADYDFELEYYNSDGNIGSLCGNGARCSIKYAFENITNTKNETKFLCNNGVYSGEKINDQVFKFFLNSVDKIELDNEIILNNKKIKTHFLNNGSPHLVIFWNDFEILTNDNFDNFNIYELGKKIRYSKYFKPGGTNVNFLKPENDYIKIRTYERGVEAETLACGTGTVASAIISNLKQNIRSPITFLTRGNDNLLVEFVKNNSKFNKITLTGPAKINYIGTYNF